MDNGFKIVIIIAGGILTQKMDQKSGCYVPNSDISEIGDSLKSSIKASNVEVVPFAAIDSSSADLDVFYCLGKLIQRKINIPQTKGVIVIYGTDTLEILAYYLHRSVYHHEKPIVITGAVRDVNNNDFDGKGNLSNSLKQVLDPECVNYAAGVTVNFAGKIHSPAYIQKEHTFAIDPFSSGKLGLIGMMHIHSIAWYNKTVKSYIIPLPNRLESVPILYAYPGVTEDYLDGFLGGQFKGLVIVGYGSGNVCDNMYFAIKKATEKGVKVVLVTNCKFGGINSEYGGIGGNQSLKDLGVIMANDLNAYQAMVVGSLIFGNSLIPNGANLDNYFNNKILM